MITDAKRTVYVGNLPKSITKELLYNAFIPFGEIVSIIVHNTGRSEKAYAYIEFEDREDVEEALKNMDYSTIYDRTIRVSRANIQKQPDSTTVEEDQLTTTTPNTVTSNSATA
ncbi:RNA-binding protein [Schizosaccharomyces japonicus yFS275]|uniref:RNA-binding protein n=1 Tax=Schizosaccharomyces japonicus (strain yFS275 / FY16936) TaxID=402676 RepID=B6K5G2_SCHJY|nr:RNA-binding protein [Schizosaccharomyces japonicus yFS275]EEB08766.1 RNA-binding protein [Schizosaccharomyces japonicus yFS275]